MARHPLDNAAWGFPSQCFVCEPANEHGLRIPFLHDDQTGTVTAEFSLGPAFSGAPRYVHGGVVLAILDEAMAWAAIALAGRFAVVSHTATTFDRPVRIGRPHRVEATIEHHDESSVTARAEVTGPDDRRCARAHARLVVLSAERASAAIGTVDGDDIRYLRRDTSAS